MSRYALLRPVFSDAGSQLRPRLRNDVRSTTKGFTVQISTSAPVDPAVTAAAIGNQIDVAVAQKAMQVQKQQGEAAVELIQNAVDVGQQLASGHIDVRL